MGSWRFRLTGVGSRLLLVQLAVNQNVEYILEIHHRPPPICRNMLQSLRCNDYEINPVCRDYGIMGIPVQPRFNCFVYINMITAKV